MRPAGLEAAVSAVLALPRLPSAWRSALPALALVLVAALAVYRDTFASMVAIWARSDTFAHAFLVPPIALWLVWRRRGALRAAVPQPQPWLLLPMALFALLWFVGDLAGANVVTQFCGVLAVVLAVPTVLGLPVARVIAFPLAFLLFMVPTGEFVMPLLMQWTADVTVASLRAFGIPVYREGLTFVIPSGTWSVIEACSGVRYLIASFMVGTLFAYLQYRSTRRRVAFALFSLVVPIVANWARAVLIVLLGHLSNNRIAVGVDHLIYGWVFFGIVISLMFIVGARWSEAPAPADPPARGMFAAAGTGSQPLLWGTALAIVLVWLVPQAVQGGRGGPAPLAAPMVLPMLVAGPEQVGEAGPAFAPVFEGAMAEASRTYANAAGPITVHVAYYRQQATGRKLVSSQNVLAASNDKVWRSVSEGTRELQVGGQRVVVRTAELRSGAVGQHGGGLPRHVRSVYWSDGRLTISDVAAVLYAVRGELAGRGDDAAAITFSMPGADPEVADAALDDFVARQLPVISNWLDGMRARR